MMRHFTRRLRLCLAADGGYIATFREDSAKSVASLLCPSVRSPEFQDGGHAVVRSTVETATS